MEKLGVENLTSLLLWGARLSSTVTEAIMDDGKIDFSEGLDIGKHALSIPLSSIKKFFPELKDMDAEEKQLVIEKFAEEFSIPNQEAELKVEQSISIILGLAYDIIDAYDIKEPEE